MAKHDAEIEDWLRDEVVPTMMAHDPAKAIPIAQARKNFEEYIRTGNRSVIQRGSIDD